MSACGSSDDSSSSSGSKSSGSSDAQLTKVKADWQKAQEPVKWNGPTDVVQAPKGKSIVILACPLIFQGCSVASENAAEAADALGWDHKLIEVADPTTYGAKFATALTQKPSAILTIGFEATVLPQAALAQAKGDGIPVVDFNGFCKTGPKGCDASQSFDVEEMGRLQALGVIVATDGKARMLNFVNHEQGTGYQNNEQTIKWMGQLCSDCKVLSTTEWLTATLTAKLPAQTVAEARKHPDANILLTSFDPVAGVQVPALTNAGLGGRVKVVSNVGLKQNLQWVANKNVQVADVANALDWGTWAAMDKVVRLLLDPKKPLPDENSPLKLMTEANAPKSGIWDDDGVDFKSEYKKLWSLGG